MTSNFKGAYYPESCKKGKSGVKINQDRPYYMILFGNTNSINTALRDIVVFEDLPGFKENARFFIINNIDLKYGILDQGEQKQGEFELKDRTNQINNKVINNAKRGYKGRSRGASDEQTYLQFAIGVDYSKFPIPESYLLNKNNYEVGSQTGYEIQNIINISDLDKSSITYKNIIAKNKNKFTHLIVVRASESLYGDLEIKLNSNMPKWVTQTGTVNDCDIIGDTSKTFAFNLLMQGINGGYEKINNKKEYLNMNLKINADD